MKKLNVEVKMSQKKVDQIVQDETLSKSMKMKNLFEMGMEIKEIANLMNVRYNFVYNVISNYVNMNGIETVTNKKEGKKDQIIELFKQGKSNKEISIELKTNYNYVFNTIKQYKNTQQEGTSE